MERTTFAGLTVLDADESLYSDGASFLNRNPRIIDHLLRVGAQTHRHDAHAPVADPATAPTLAIEDGGLIPADTRLWVGFTLIDDDGGETMISPLASAQTPAPMAPPGAPTVAADYASGTLEPGMYYYGLTLLDDEGGETILGQPTSVFIEQSGATAELTGLAALLGSAQGYAVYKSTGGPYYYVATAASGTFRDDGTLCPDCTREPPFTSTAESISALRIDVPSAAVPEVATNFRIYAARDESMASPSLLVELPRASAGIPYLMSATVFSAGSPPPVSLSKGGATKIDPDTELIDYHWKRPVLSSAALPAGEPGDVRMALNDRSLWGVGSASAAGPADWQLLNLLGPEGPPGPEGPQGPIGPQGSAGLGAQPRDTVAVETINLIPNQSAQGTVALGKSVRLLKVATDRPARVRLYVSVAHRNADVSRPIGTDPTGDHGLILEVVTSAALLALTLTPEATGANMEDPVSADMAYTITNLDTVFDTVLTTFTRQVLEQ